MRTLIVVALAVAGTAHAQVYRCQEGGRTVYSDKPCGEAAATQSVPVVPRAAPSPGADAGAALQLEALRGRVAVGMSKQQVELAWGRPMSTNSRTGSRGTSDQWVYRRSNASTSYVYFEDGVVTSYNTETTTNIAASEPAPQSAIGADPNAIYRAERAGDRRFIREGESRDSIERRIGKPDSFAAEGIYFVTTYRPTPKDYQTRTTIYFDSSDRAAKIERTVER